MGLIAVAADEYCVSYVLEHLRRHCMRELCLTRDRPFETTLQEHYDIIQRLRWAQMVRAALFSTEGPSEPIAIAIAYRLTPAVAELQSFSTWHWDKIALPFVRWFRRQVVPVLVQNNINVAEANILLEGPAHFRWWQALGFYRSGGPLPCGVNGELYQRMVWTREAAHVRHRQGVYANLHAAGNGRRGSGANPAASGHPAATAATHGGDAKIIASGGGRLDAANGGDQGVAPGRPPGVR